jgi:hypothetical protein
MYNRKEAYNGKDFKGYGNVEKENGHDFQSGSRVDSDGRCECSANPSQVDHKSDIKISFHAEKELKRV